MATPDSARQVRRWIETEEYAIQEIPDQRAALNLLIRDVNGNNFNVLWFDDAPGRILLGTALSLPEEHQRIFSAVPESRQNEFFHDLRKTLLMMGLGHFEGVSRPFQRIMLYALIYEDGMDRDRFMSRLALLQRALILVMDMINRELELRPAWEQAP